MNSFYQIQQTTVSSNTCNISFLGEQKENSVELIRIIVVHENDKGYKILVDDYYMADNVSRAIIMAMDSVDEKYAVEDLTFYGGKVSKLEV